MLAINDLHVSVENKEIIKGITLAVHPGEIHAVMGPNGSGKSTLAYAVAGHPRYQISDIRSSTSSVDRQISGEQGLITLDEEDISGMTPDQRANLGLFLATQHPMAVPGLTTISFLWQIYKKRSQMSDPPVGEASLRSQKKISLLEFRKWMTSQAQALGLDPELLKRGINDGFSGGEKKKTEVLQMLVANPKYIVLDEIDSGLDVDAIKKIGLTLAKMAEVNKIGIVIITHDSKILEYLKPQFVHVIKDGKIVEEGGAELVDKVLNYGFDKVNA